MKKVYNIFHGADDGQENEYNENCQKKKCKKHIWKLIKTEYYDAVLTFYYYKCCKCSKTKKEPEVRYL